MYTKTNSAVLQGIDAQIIGIEIDTGEGVPGFTIVGLAGKSITEAKDRVNIAFKSLGFDVEPKKILVNLFPAHLRKEGTHFDLAIAAALMVNYGYIDVRHKLLEHFALFGELSLTGDLKQVIGILPLALEAQRSKIKYLIVPEANRKESSLISLAEEFKSEIYAIRNLDELKPIIEAIEQINEGPDNEEQKLELETTLNLFRVEALDPNKLGSFYQVDSSRDKVDISDVIGQNLAKRGLEIAAAGRHHVLMIGPPGCGKSMLANRFRYLLPGLSFNEALELTKIYSVSGLLNDDDLILDPPLRAPHHSTSNAALVGGGSAVKPGEVSLAHKGVLFLDELTEFNRHTIEQLRQVLEDKYITINRIKQSLRFPADFVMIAACNPCPCGYLGDRVKSCTCSPNQITNYIGKLSGPLLDRIDIHVELSRLTQDEIKMLSRNVQKPSLDSLDLPLGLTKTIRDRAIAARSFAANCSHDYILHDEALKFIDNAVSSLELSARSHQKILRIARTIANLAESVNIEVEHLAEALQFRSVDWGRYRR